MSDIQRAIIQRAIVMLLNILLGMAVGYGIGKSDGHLAYFEGNAKCQQLENLSIKCWEVNHEI